MVVVKDDEFVELAIICDTREGKTKIDPITLEKYSSRVKRISEFFEERGGIAVKEKLDFGDYSIQGKFRGKEINLNIEYKTMIDFSRSYNDLNEKLFRAYKQYDDVGLFVEENNISLSHSEHGCFIKNFFVENINGGVINYYHYKNLIETFMKNNVHVRTFNNEAFFPYELYGLLIYISEDCHIGLYINGGDFKTQMINVLCGIPGIGGKSAHKIIEVVPNLNYLGSVCDGLYQKILGKINGKKLDAFIHDTSRIEECRENRRKLFDVEDVEDSVGFTKKEPDIPNDVVTQKDSLNKKITDSNNISSHPSGTQSTPLLPLDDTSSHMDGTETLLLIPSIDKNNSSHPEKPLFPNPLQLSFSGTDQQADHHLPAERGRDFFISPSSPPMSMPLTEYTSVYNIERSLVEYVESNNHPVNDSELIRFIMGSYHCEMAEAHKMLREILSTSHQLHISKGIVTYCGVKPDKDIDIGV